MGRIVRFVLVASALVGLAVSCVTYLGAQQSIEGDPTVACVGAAGCPTSTP